MKFEKSSILMSFRIWTLHQILLGNQMKEDEMGGAVIVFVLL